MPTTWRSGKQPRQRVEGDAVGRVVEGRDEHETVCDIEVGVAGRETLSLEIHRPGHGQLDDTQGLPVLVAGRLKAPEVVLERLVVWVVGARLDGRDDGLRVDKPREVVDVSVRVVAGDSAPQPDDVPRAQVAGEDPLELGAAHTGISGLDFAEQAFLGRQ